MNTFELVLNIEDFLEYQEGYRPFMEGLKLFSDYADKGIQILSTMEEGQDVNEIARAFQLSFAKLIEKRNQIENRFFKSRNLFSLKIVGMIALWPESRGWLGKINRNIQKFSRDYDRYIRTDIFIPERAYEVANDAKSLSIQIQEMIKAFKAISERLDVPLLLEGKSGLTLYFPEYVGVSDTADKLKALNNIYEEACGLFNVSTVEYPLVIRKLETGSFWVNVVGSAIIMTAVTSWIEKGAIYIYEHWTQQGQIAAITEKAEHIENLLGLRTSLKKANIDTRKMDNHIREASIKISADLETLVTQSGIRINGVLISPNTQDAKVQLGHAKSKEIKKVETSINKLPPPKPK